jgi:tRNA(fMet)-specific endonuclease VapC
MSRYVLDTNALSDFINRRRGVDARVDQARHAGHVIGTCVPVIGELFYGLELSATRDVNVKRAKVGIRQIKVWPFIPEAGEEFGRFFAHLQRHGRVMQIVDIQLAAIALTLGNCTVVTSDSDLSAVPGLAVENWAA